jgi:hypothetical protein
VLACLRPQRQSEQSGRAELALLRAGRRATMVFNLQSKVVNDWRGDERKLFGTLT